MGGLRFEEIAARHGATVNYKLVKLSEIFPATGGLPLAKRAPERQAHRLPELERWRTFLDIPINLRPKHFPVPEWPATGMVIAADQPGSGRERLTNALLRAVWAEERDISDTDTLRVIATENDMDGTTLLAQAEEDARCLAHVLPRDNCQEAHFPQGDIGHRNSNCGACAAQ